MEQLSAFSFGDYFPYLGWIDLRTALILCRKATFGAVDFLLNQVLEGHIENQQYSLSRI